MVLKLAESKGEMGVGGWLKVKMKWVGKNWLKVKLKWMGKNG